MLVIQFKRKFVPIPKNECLGIVLDACVVHYLNSVTEECCTNLSPDDTDLSDMLHNSIW